MTPTVHTVTEHVWVPIGGGLRELRYVAGDVIAYDEAVRLGLVEPPKPKAAKPRRKPASKKAVVTRDEITEA